MRRPAPRVERDARPEVVAVLEELVAPAVAAATPEPGIDPAIWDRVLVGMARELLARPGKRIRARLVELSFELAGGAGAPPPALRQLVELVHAGSLIVDDVQDGALRRRGGPALHHVCGTPLAINTGTWLYFAAYHVIDGAGLADGAALEVHRRLTRALLHGHQGQALDLAIDVTELRQREVPELADAAAALKTGALMSFAAELGGIAAGAPPDVRAALAGFGIALGVGLQHLDDLGGLCNGGRRDKGREDLAGRRLTWPWAYLARELDEVRFAKLQRRLRDARGTLDALDAFAAELAELLGDGARRRACARLGDARARLEAAFPGHAALAKVDAALAALERDAG
jgi:geranylgeranyl pyrophosphate synthase